MIRWMRIVLPPGWTIGAILGLYATVEGLRAAIGWALRRCAAEPIMPPKLEKAGIMVVFIGVACYGVYRATAFNPVFRPGYRRWLEQTPWAWEKPLPLGPLHLVWQDTIVLAVLYGLIVLPHPHCLASPDFDPHVFLLAFLLPYLAILGACFLVAGLKRFTYGLGSTLSLLIPLRDDALGLLALGLALYVIAWFGIRRMLRAFPWPLEKLEAWIRRNTNPTQRLQFVVPWPFDRLPMDAVRCRISPRDGFLLSLLVAWWVVIATTFGSRLRGDEDIMWGLMAVAVTEVAVVLRIIIYCLGYRPPIGFWGRIFTLRWVIPGYDKVFLAPLCAALVAILVPFGCHWLGIPFSAAFPATIFLMLLVTLNMGPTLRDWQLTGSHRIVPGVQQRNDCVIL